MVEHALRSTLLFLSRQSELKDVATSLGPFKKVADRFVAGEDLTSALEAVERLNAQGCMATLDHLGEDVASAEQAARELVEYKRMLARISLKGVKSNVSVKLSQLGLAFDEALALENARALVTEAKSRGIFVRLDMEGSALTEKTLRLYRRLREDFGVDDVGVALQSYLRRTERDARELLEIPSRIRLCKGAYKEPPELAFPDKRDVDRTYLQVTRLLLESGGYHALATHDPKMIDGALSLVRERGLPKDAFEFQMLYGIRRDLQLSLAQQGFNVRVYVPYGRAWYPYLMRRLAERPANLWFVVKNAVRG